MRAVIASAIVLGCIGVALAQTSRIATSYTTQLRTGSESMKTPEGWTFGTMYDVNFKPLYVDGKIVVSHNSDFTSLVKVSLLPRLALYSISVYAFASGGWA
jgi:hypothetical protein